MEKIFHFFKLMKLKVEEFKKLENGVEPNSFNFMHLWLKLIIDKKMGGERLNEKVLIQSATCQNLMHFRMRSLLLYIYILID